MAAEEVAGLPRESASETHRVPIPDPTTRSIELVEREISHLRELMEASQKQTADHLDVADAQADARFKIQIEDIRRQVEAKFREQDTAVQAALVSSDKAIKELSISTTQRMEALQTLNDNKFITYRTLLDAQADKVKIAVEADNKLVSAAFESSKEAIRAAFESSKEAIQKAEIFNEKRFELMTKQIDELRTQQALLTGKGLGASALWGFLAAAVFLVIAVISFANGFGNN